MSDSSRPGRLHSAIAELATFNDDPASGGITREVYTPTYARALERVVAWMREVGLEPRLDAVGNLYGSWTGTDATAPRVLTGSHVDTTLNAGAYDGVLGVLGAIEAVRTLRDAGFTPRRTVEVIAWAGEEPRFGTGCVGSRCAAGDLSRADLDRLVDRDGITMAVALREAGFDPDAVKDAVVAPPTVHALVELHIEQAIVLETHGEPIGVVEAIAAPHDFRIVFEGAATHAGATPMGLRRDALVGAAEAVAAIEEIARGSSSGTTVGTVGVIRALPGAINVVPGVASLDVDVRDSDEPAREAVVAAIVDAARAIGTARGLDVGVEEIVTDTPVACDAAVVAASVAACEQLGLTYRRMISGAYHDAMIMGRRVPVGMIFVPSRGGVSHHPDEYTSPQELDRGVAVLAGTLRRLAS
ncbi:N-carbamoyl-L-amino acid hydrolase [Baekduia alba]|uniref:M20 family metallo-hydrolase n=1 Tax=Baekduia alba TaxID=2997333 RepID=UPI00234110BF|nr:M20 family metallo-hydrolase [Baekduia alba]WCB94586.1 N-carbamoyl-L-amino acid hydrolase [Baekduia alba]